MKWKFRPDVELRFEVDIHQLNPDIGSRWRTISGYGDSSQLTKMCESWIQHCQLPSNQALVPLKRVEQGICTKDEQRQIRFKGRAEIVHPTNEVIAYVHKGVWSVEELTDLLAAFVTMFNEILTEAKQPTYCTGTIDMSLDPLTYEKERARVDSLT